MGAFCVWQVFVNTVSVGFLDYERRKIVIPLIQVCFLRSWVGISTSHFLNRFAGVKEEDLEHSRHLIQGWAWRVGQSVAF